MIFLPTIVSAIFGWLAAPSFLHPIRRPLTADLIREADVSIARAGAHRQDFSVRARDGSNLRGWKVRAATPNGDWVLVFHGVADNRVGIIGQSELLLRNGYSVVLMDARAHGASEGAIATYGWLERDDTRTIVDALVLSEHPRHLLALGESMGAGIALQSAGVDERIEAVVAESSFADLREASYDYAGLQKYPLLGKTLFAPGAWSMLYRGETLAGFPAGEVSPKKAVASRAFPILLICDSDDRVLPCRHTETIFEAAIGPKQMWVVQKSFHTAALGNQPAEFERRVVEFFAHAIADRSRIPVVVAPRALLSKRTIAQKFAGDAVLRLSATSKCGLVGIATIRRISSSRRSQRRGSSPPNRV